MKGNDTAVFIASGKQMIFDPAIKEQFIYLDFQKNAQPGDQIVFDKVLSKGEEFGQPYLKDTKIIGQVVKHAKKKKIVIMKYKAKKRTKKTQGFRSYHTLVKLNSLVSG
jgi:large subunit ribosomal protein L21